MKIFTTNSKLLLVAIVAIVTVSGCLDVNGSKSSSRIQFGLRLDSLRSPQGAISGDDSVTVTQFRFVFGDGSIVFADSSIALAADEDTYTSFSVPNRNGQNPILISRGPFSNNPTYQGFVLSVKQAPDGNTNIDGDFIDSNHHYSMIIDGSYNGSDFSFRSEHAFKDTLNFNPVTVQENNKLYNFILNATVSRWFLANDGSFLDPSNDENDSKINENIEQSFSLEVIPAQNL